MSYICHLCCTDVDFSIGRSCPKSISPVSVSTMGMVMSCLWNMTVSVKVTNEILSDQCRC